MTKRMEISERNHTEQLLVREVLRHVCRGIVAMPEFILIDGVRARVGGYLVPGTDIEGRMMSGFDVFFENGRQVEFLIVAEGEAAAGRPAMEWQHQT